MGRGVRPSKSEKGRIATEAYSERGEKREGGAEGERRTRERGGARRAKHVQRKRIRMKFRQ